MNKNKLIIYILIFTIISWTGFALVLNKMEPCVVYSASQFCEKVSSISLILFYLSLFLSLTASITLIGYIGRIYLNNNEVFTTHFNSSLRQAILLSIALVICTILLTNNILKLWTSLIVFTAILLIEFYFFNQE